MSSVIRSVLGVALLLTGASAAMAQSANPPVAASTTIAATNNAPVAAQPRQTGASTAVAVTNNAPVAGSAQKPRGSGIADNTDRYGGHDPNSTAGSRAFWEGVNPY